MTFSFNLAFSISESLQVKSEYRDAACRACESPVNGCDVYDTRKQPRRCDVGWAVCYRYYMRFVMSVAFGSLAFLFSFSFVLADTTSDLLSVLGQTAYSSPAAATQEANSIANILSALGASTPDPAAALMAALGTTTLGGITASQVNIPAVSTSSAPETNTDSERAQQIAELQTLVQTLTAQMQQIIAKKTAQQTQVASSTPGQSDECANLTLARSLSRGMQGEDVRCMQLVLVASGFLNADYATGFFGAFTEMAVKAFQSEHGIASTGFVGPLTLAELKTLQYLLATGGSVVSVTTQSDMTASLNGGPLIISSPLKAYAFDVITEMPVTIQIKDPRVVGAASVALLSSVDAAPQSGVVLGDMQIVSNEVTTKFSLTQVRPGAYWVQVVAPSFQDCSSGICKKLTPTATVGPIKISDASGYWQAQDASVSATSTADTIQ
jgi:peptidoglycan hydrolase-like protein with peptidoglycan-binding domain